MESVDSVHIQVQHQKVILYTRQMFNTRGEPEDACMKLVVYVIMSSFAEASSEGSTTANELLA